MRTLLSLLLIYISVNAIDLDDREEYYQMGKEIYDLTCKTCHGEDGRSKVDVSFVVEPRDLKKSILSEEQMYYIIRDGAHYWGAHADIMPSFKSVYLEEELRAVAYYTSRFNLGVEKRVADLMAKSKKIPKEKLSKMSARGKKIYKRNCMWCHGITGDGCGEATHNPELSIFPYSLQKSILNEDQLFLYSKYGGKFWGTHKDDMSAWSVKYDDFTLKSVVKYIRDNIQKKRQ